MVREIIQIGDKRLLEKSKEIKVEEIGSEEIKKLAKDLMETTIFHNEHAAGLSAVQLGILKRIFVVKKFNAKGQDLGEYEVIINPKVIEKSSDLSMEWEGCMSIASGDQRLYGPVERSREIKIEYTDLKGKTHSLTAKNFFSHLIQHELDHLDGVLFLKHVKNIKNIWKEDELDKYLNKYRQFPEIK